MQLKKQESTYGRFSTEQKDDGSVVFTNDSAIRIFPDRAHKCITGYEISLNKGEIVTVTPCRAFLDMGGAVEVTSVTEDEKDFRLYFSSWDDREIIVPPDTEMVKLTVSKIVKPSKNTSSKKDEDEDE